MASITLDAITLPADLQWIDEFAWAGGVVQSQEYSLDGTQILQEATRQAGRPITLQGGQDGSWTQRSVVESIYAKLVEDTDMTLTIHGTAYTVRWRFADNPLEVAEVIRRADPGSLPDHYYTITMRFLEV